MVYRCVYDDQPVAVPELDVWEALLGREGRRDGKTLVIDALTGRSLSYGEGRRLALQLAHGLRASAGLKPGDVLCLLSPNSLLYPIILMACQAAGIVATLSNPTYTQKELVHQLHVSGATVILASSDLLQLAKQSAQKAGISANMIYLLPGLDGKISPVGKSYENLVSAATWRHEPVRGKELDKPAYLPFSSGTTGLGKGVTVTHRNVVAMSAMLERVPQLLDSRTIMLCVLPCFHIFALTVCIHHVIYSGGTIVIVPKFEMASFLQAVTKYKPTNCCIVPPIALGLARHPLAAKTDFSSIREFIIGAAPMSAALTEEATKAVGVPIHQGWGMTETTSVSTVNRPGQHKVGTCGRLVPGQEARIVKEGGKDAAAGEAGELWVRGPNIVSSYYGNAKATQETFTKDGWLMTGDVGVFDKDGYLSIVDRTKELIKYKGFQVPPAELEALLLGCDLVSDAAVIGVYSEKDATELPRAYVVLSESGKKNEEPTKAIEAFVRERVAAHKRLRGGVHVIDVIPKSASGKILRKDLRAMAAREEQTRAKL